MTTEENTTPNKNPADGDGGNKSLDPKTSQPGYKPGYQIEKPPSSDDLKTNFLNFFRVVVRFVRMTMNITEGTDQQGTIDGIKKDIDFKGVNVWILIFSIFIASIGLNLNSTAVVIGAMLISPLMGPILGVGLSVAINDWATLTRSLKSLGVAVSIALLTSFLYFLITPLSDPTENILARTKPNILDALVAIFGGFAGIIAGSRKEKTNVIPGVAIATALMPPLCTAGYGLAIGNISFFLGAFYLFFLNALFISLATLVTVRYLKFPVKEFVDPTREKRVKRQIVLFLLVVMIPSGWLFVDVVRESIFTRNAEAFVNEQIKYPGATVIQQEYNFADSIPTISVSLIGEIVPQPVVTGWVEQLSLHSLEGVRLQINQGKDMSSEMAEFEGDITNKLKSGLLEEMYTNNKEVLADREREIRSLKRQISALQLRQKADSIPFGKVSFQALQFAPEIEHFSFARTLDCKPNGDLDTVYTAMVQWPGSLSKSDKRDKQLRLGRMLANQLDIDTVRVVDFAP